VKCRFAFNKNKFCGILDTLQNELLNGKAVVAAIVKGKEYLGMF